MEKYWIVSLVDPNEIVKDIDKIIDRTDWGNDEFSHSWKTNTNKLDIDAWMYLNQEDGMIEEFSFRIDLRNKTLLFLHNMIELGKRYKWVFMDRNGTLSKPNIEAAKELIRNSKEYGYLKDSYKFLDN